jgi:hypothetical protein
MSVNPIGGVTNVSSMLQPTAAQVAAAQGVVPGSATSTAAQTAPTVDAAQAWEEAMRAAMGDESSSDDSSSDPISSLANQTSPTAASPSAASALATPTGAAASPSGGAALTQPADTTAGTPSTAATTSTATTPTAATTPLSPQALAALISGSSTAPTDPLITSLSAPSVDTTQAPPVSDADASSFV